MENVPYAVLRIESVDGTTTRGYAIVCPYHAARQYVSETEPVPLPGFLPDTIKRRLWQELPALTRTAIVPLDSQLAAETFLIAEELGATPAVLLTVEGLGLASPDYAAQRINSRVADWILAETERRPLCPFSCPRCGMRLEQRGIGTISDPSEPRMLPYRCPVHDAQEAEYDPIARRWCDLRVA